LLVVREMREPAEPPCVSERDLEEVLMSLEVELFGPPPKKRECEDSTRIHPLPQRD